MSDAPGLHDHSTGCRPGMAREHYRPEEVVGRILGPEAPASAAAG